MKKSKKRDERRLNVALADFSQTRKMTKGQGSFFDATLHVGDLVHDEPGQANKLLADGSAI